jgi:hypothetical protein
MGLAPEHKASTKVPNDKSDENDAVDDEDGLDGEDGGADLEKH